MPNCRIRWPQRHNAIALVLVRRDCRSDLRSGRKTVLDADSRPRGSPAMIRTFDDFCLWTYVLVDEV